MANFLTKAFSGFRRSFDLDTYAATYTKSELYAWFNVQDGIDSGAILSSLKAYAQNTWVNKCVNVISAAGAMLPLELYQGTTKVADVHPFLTFMRQPNPYMTREQLFYRTLSIMLLQGECFWWIIRKGSRETNNVPESVWILDPRVVKEQLTDTYPQSIKNWRVRTPFGDITLNPLDVAHFKIPHPDKAFRGGAPLDAAGLAISADVAAARWNYRFFKNSALPTGILSTDQPLTETQARQIRRRWEETSRGEDNAHRVQVTYRGLKWMQVQGSRKDMEFKEQRLQLQQEICAAFGVPGLKLGLLDGATYANSDAQKELFWTQTVMPYLRLIESTLDQAIVRDDSLESYLNTDNVEDIRAIVARKVDTAVKMFSIGWPLNLIDKRLDIGMGDVAWGNEGFLPYTVQPASLALEPPDPTPLPGSDPNADPNAPPKTKPPKDTLPPAKTVAEVQARMNAWQLKGSFAAKVHTALDELRAVAEVALLPGEEPVIDLPTESRAAIVDVLRTTNADDALRTLKTVVGTPVVPRDATIYDRILTWSPRVYVSRATTLGDDDITSIISKIHDGDGALKKIGAQYITQGFHLGIGAAKDLVVTDFDLDNPEAKAFIDAKTLAITQINDTTAEQVREALLKGVDDGLGTDDIADSIVDVFDVAYSRARTIARTELSSATNGGRYLTFKDAGATRHAWLTSGDDRVRDSHVEVDGEEVDIGDEFPVVNLLFPGDPAGEASEIVNCRCVAVPVFDTANEKALFGTGYIKGLSLEGREALWRVAIAGLVLPERLFTKRLKKYFRLQKANVLAALADLKLSV